MKVTIKWLLFFGATTILLGGMFVEQTMAVDCGAVLDAAKKERSLLKQEAMLKEALTECSKDAAVNYRYGYALERLRKYDEALKFYKAAVKFDGKTAKYHFGIADIYTVLEDLPSAVKAYEKGLKLNPQNSRARRSLEEIQTKIKPVQVAKKPKPKVKVKAVEKKVAEKKAPVIKKPVVAEKVEKKPVKKKTVVAEKTPKQKIKKSETVVKGPTLKPEIPDNSKLSVLSQALKSDKVRQSEDDLSAAPGGPEFKTKLASMQEKLRNSARTDALAIDSERMQVVK